MPAAQGTTDDTPSVGPDPRPFGAIALGLAVVSAALAATGFFSPLAYLGAVLATPFAIGARGIPAIRWMGTAALVLCLVAVLVATAWIIWMF